MTGKKKRMQTRMQVGVGRQDRRQTDRYIGRMADRQAGNRIMDWQAGQTG